MHALCSVQHDASFELSKTIFGQFFKFFIINGVGGVQKLPDMEKKVEKSRIRETSNLSTDADSSTDATVGWTKNTQKPKKKFNEKNNPKQKYSETSRDMPKFAIYPSTRSP